SGGPAFYRLGGAGGGVLFDLAIQTTWLCVECVCGLRHPAGPGVRCGPDATERPSREPAAPGNDDVDGAVPRGAGGGDLVGHAPGPIRRAAAKTPPPPAKPGVSRLPR